MKKRIKRAPRAARLPEVMPRSIDPSYTCRDVTQEPLATLRSGGYFVQLAPYAPFQLARYSRATLAFNMHEMENVKPYRVFTCSKYDVKGTYIGQPIDLLTSGHDPAAYRSYL